MAAKTVDTSYSPSLLDCWYPFHYFLVDFFSLSVSLDISSRVSAQCNMTDHTRHATALIAVGYM